MIHLERSIPANPPGSAPQVTRAEIWEGHIDEDAAGALSLRFTFALEVRGALAGSAEELGHVERMRRVYFDAVDATLAAIRRHKSERRGGIP